MADHIQVATIIDTIAGTFLDYAVLLAAIGTLSMAFTVNLNRSLRVKRWFLGHTTS